MNYTNNLAPGETFSPDDALDALKSVGGLLISGNEIATPSGPVVPRAVQCIRTSFELATATNDGQPLSLTTNPDQIITD